MKIDMEKLAGTVTRKNPPRPLIKTAAALTMCLALMGSGMVFRALQMRDSASAHEAYDPALADPSFTVQTTADVTLPDIRAGEGPIAVLTRKGGGYSATPDEEGLLATRTERISLYADYKTSWTAAATLEQMSRVAPDSESYELKEVWIGKNPSSASQSDFLVAKTDGTNVVFTNNPANPDLSRAEGGYYVPGEDGTYTLCIEDGSVVRLVYGEKDGWSYLDAKVSDFDITDGGYYLEDDYFHRGGQHGTLEAAYEKDTLYIDAIQAGINSEENYKGTGTKLAFGGGTVGMDLAEESLSGELDTLNIYNCSRENGVTDGLVEGLTADGLPVWAAGVSAPDLFGGDAKGKTAYDTGYSLAFKKKGTGKTLSAVESEWGTAAEGLNKTDASAWIADGMPSFGTDGHDVPWGTGDEGKLFYKSGDRVPDVLPASLDGLEHNKYFGLSWTEDFVLEPGYTGPLNVFGVSDDDMWVFAARVDEEGRVMDGTPVTALDLGGVHGKTGWWTDLWDIIEKVPYGAEAQHWRLYVFWLERDGQDAGLMFSCNLPEMSITNTRETGTVVVEAANYESVEGAVRTFLLDPGTHDFYKLTYSDGREITITAGESFQIPSGMSASIDGMDKGTVFRVRETGRENVWHSTGEGFLEGDTVECTVGSVHRVSFLSTMDPGTLSLAAAADGDPEGGYRFTIHLEGLGDKEISAMDGYNSPLGTQFTDKDGNLEAVLSAGEILTLYGLPDGTEFTVTPQDTSGWHLAEILLDNAQAEGTKVTGRLPAYVIYRYQPVTDQPVQVLLEQSVSGDWTAEDVNVKKDGLISYCIRLTNPNAEAVNLSVEDRLPDGLIVQESSVMDGRVNGQTIHWDVTVEPGSTLELAFTCQAADKGEFENTVVLMDGLDPQRASNTVKAKAK